MNKLNVMSLMQSRAVHRKAGRRAVLALGMAMVLARPGEAATTPDDFPSKPIKFIISWPPGGSADVVGRLVAERLSKRIGQPVIVENRAGAGGRIGTLAVVRAEPDGCTLLFAAPSELTIAAATVQTMPYDPIKDLQPVIQVMAGPYVLVANPDFPPNTLAEMKAYAKANPNKVNYASFGNNTLNHLYGEQLNVVTGMDTVHVAYKGGSPAVADLVSGQVQYMFDNAGSVMPLVKTGKLKAIAVMAPQRLASAPAVPTMAEAGAPDFGSGTWLGILAPAKTPKAIVDKLHDELAAVLTSAEMGRMFEERAIRAVANTPDEFGTLIKSEVGKWQGLVAKLGLKME